MMTRRGSFRRFLYPIVLAAGLFVALASPSPAGTLMCHEESRDCDWPCSGWGIWNGWKTTMYSECCWIDPEMGLVPSCYTSITTLCAYRCFD